MRGNNTCRAPGPKQPVACRNNMDTQRRIASACASAARLDKPRQPGRERGWQNRDCCRGSMPCMKLTQRGLGQQGAAHPTSWMSACSIKPMSTAPVSVDLRAMDSGYRKHSQRATIRHSGTCSTGAAAGSAAAQSCSRQRQVQRPGCCRRQPSIMQSGPHPDACLRLAPL